MLITIFNIVVPIFFIVLVGYFYGRHRQPEMHIVNQINLEVFIPALIFVVITKKDFYPSEYIYLITGGIAVILGSGILGYFLARILSCQWRTLVPPVMFSNWANLGLPLYLFSFGEPALNAGVMLVIVGNIIYFTLGHIILAGRFDVTKMLREPILIAVIVGLLFSAFNVQIPVFLGKPLDMMGQVAIPLMLFSLGVRLTRVGWNDSAISLIAAVSCPVFGVAVAYLMTQILPLTELHKNILILFGVLPPAVMNFILAEKFKQEPQKVASIVLLGNLVSVFSIPILLYFLLG